MYIYVERFDFITVERICRCSLDGRVRPALTVGAFSESHDVLAVIKQTVATIYDNVIYPCISALITDYCAAKMPGIVKKLIVVAAADGLLLCPSGQRNQRSLQIKYVTREILPIRSSRITDESASADIHGIVGTRHLMLRLRYLSDLSGLRSAHHRLRLVLDRHSRS